MCDKRGALDAMMRLESGNLAVTNNVGATAND